MIKSLLVDKVIGKKSYHSGKIYPGFEVTEQNLNKHLKLFSKYILAKCVGSYLNKICLDEFLEQCWDSADKLNFEDFVSSVKQSLSWTKKSRHEWYSEGMKRMALRIKAKKAVRLREAKAKEVLLNKLTKEERNILGL